MNERRNENEISLVAILNAFLRHRWLIVGISAVALLAGLGIAALRGTRYVSEASFMPRRGEEGMSSLSGVAAQFGIDVGTGGGDPLEFYVALIESREVLSEVARSSYWLVDPERGDSTRRTFIEVMELGDRTAERQLREAVAALRDRVQARAELQAGIVELEVTHRRPELATQLSRRILDLLEQFNLERRRSQAGGERQFVEERLADAGRELDEAEEALREFLEENRSYEGSPQLTFQFGRLQRRVDLRQGLFMTLSQAYEQARIDEVRSTSVITIVDRPEGSVVPMRGFVTTGIIALLLGALVAVAVALSREFLAAQRVQSPEDYAVFESLRREALSDLAPWRLVRRLRNRESA